MNGAQELVTAVSERAISREVLKPFDDAAMQYRHRGPNGATTFEDYEEYIGDYYNYLFSHCVAQGGTLPSRDASSRAKGIMEQELRRHGGDIVSAYNDARDGTNGGIFAQRGMMLESLKREATSDYIRAMFDHYVEPSSYEDKVQIIRELFAVYGPQLGDDIDTEDPGRYAHDYQRIVNALAESSQRIGSVMRRL